MLQIRIFKFYFKKTITNEEDFIQITKPPGAYEIEGLNNEIESFFTDKECFTESDYPLTIKPNFLTLDSIIKIQPQGPIIGFKFDDSIRHLLGFQETILYKEYNLLPNPVDNLLFDIIFLGSDNTQGMIFRAKRCGIVHNFTMDVDPGYKYIEKFRGGIQW